MRTTTRWALVGGLVGWLGLAAGAGAAPPRVAVAACDDGTGTALGQQASEVLVKALQARGREVLAPAAYAAEAGKRGFTGKKASGLNAIRALGKALKLSGVVTCAAAKVGPQFAVSFFLFGPDGGQLLSRPLKLGASSLPAAQADSLAAALATKLPKAAAEEEAVDTGEVVEVSDTGTEDELALIPLAPPEPAPGKEDKRPDVKPVVKADVKPVVKADVKPVVKADVKVSPPETAAEPTAEVKAEAAGEEPVEAKAEGPVTSGLEAATPDIRLSLGASLHFRAGLHPRAETDTYPGARLEGRAFLGAFLSVPVLEDLGVGLLYDRTFGLGYHSEATEVELRATEERWQVELAYRLAFPEVPTGPTAMLRVGYGSLAHRVDGDFVDLPEAGYTFCYAALGGEIWLWRDWLSLRLAAGYLWSVWPDRRTSVAPGDYGQGFLVEAGLDLSVLDVLHAGLSYEQQQVVFEDRVLGETSDRFQAVVLRLGWQWR